MILLRIVHAVPRLIHTHELDSPERVGVPIPSGVVDRVRGRSGGDGRGSEHAMVMGEYGFTVPLWTQ